MPTELTPAQKQLQDQLRVLVSPIVGEIVEEQFRRNAEAGGAMKRYAELFGGATAPVQTAEQRKADIGRDAGRIVLALAGTKGNIREAQSYAEKKWGKDSRANAEFTKALAAGTGSGGGFLLPEDLSAEVIEFLRPRSAVRSLNPTMVPMDNGTLRLPKITAGAAAAYIGENANASATAPVFGQVVPSAKKLSALVPISNDLVRRGGPSVDAMVRDDLAGAIAQKSDVAFLRSPGSVGEPKGLLFWNAANNFGANGTVNAANVITDLGTAIQKLADANVRLLRTGWIFSHRTWRYLYTLLTTTSAFIFRDELSQGTLFGYPFARTSQIPNNLGGGTNESEVYIADFADVVIAEATQILLDASSEAAYFDGSSVVAAFSLDQTVIRALVEHDLVMRHDESIIVITAVKWT